MRVTIYGWSEERVRHILGFDPYRNRELTRVEVKRLKKQVMWLFYYVLLNVAWEARLETLEQRGVEDDGTPLFHEYFQLVGQDFTVRIYHYVIYGVVTHYDMLSGQMSVRLMAVGLDGEMRAARDMDPPWDMHPPA